MADDNGFVIDFGRMTRKEYREWQKGRDKAKDFDVWDATHLYSKIIVEWPFDEPITPEGYDNLSVLDARRVDEAVSDKILEIFSKKKSEP